MRLEKLAKRHPKAGEWIEFEGYLCQVRSIDKINKILVVCYNSFKKVIRLKEYPIYHIGFG